ncbi:hypothetical protein ACODNH_21500 (plasmid) [Haloarcula sp. NS06]|uniref:hypothetical protein n=1 Tax=Haloarcula sp. NS06 TaxID=3409688 RepID=UPI003DA6FF2C
MTDEINDSAKDSANPDPFLALISVIHSFITNKDRASASLGLDILAGRVSTLIAFNGDSEIAEDSPMDQSLETLCTDQIPNTVKEAVDHDLTQVGLDVSETVETIGEATIEHTAGRAFQHVITGHVELIDTLGYESAEERIRTEVMDTCKDLLKTGATSGLWESTAIGTRLLGWVAATSVMMRDREDGRNTRYGSLLVLCFPKLLNIAVKSHATIGDLSAREWLRVQMLDVHPVARLINSCYGSMAELTSAAIRYEMRTEQQIVDWGSVAHGWLEGLGRLEQSNLEEMQQLWFGTILYLEYLDAMSPDHVMDGFDPYVQYEVSKEVGQETVERIQDNSLDPLAAIQFIPGRVNPVEMPLTGRRMPIIPDAEKSFNEWLSNQIFFTEGRYAETIDSDDR